MDVSDCFGYQRCTLPDTQRLLTLTIMQLGSLRNFPPATTNYGGFCSGFPRPFVWILQGFEARLFHVELAAVGRSCGKSRATTFEVLDRKLPTKPYGLWLLRAGGVFVRLVNGVGLDAFRKEEGMPNFRTHGEPLKLVIHQEFPNFQRTVFGFSAGCWEVLGIHRSWLKQHLTCNLIVGGDDDPRRWFLVFKRVDWYNFGRNSHQKDRTFPCLLIRDGHTFSVLP